MPTKYFQVTMRVRADVPAASTDSDAMGELDETLGLVDFETLGPHGIYEWELLDIDIEVETNG